MERIKSKVVFGLKWLEKYTKTDMIYLARGGFWLGLGQVISSGSTFLISLVFANMLIPEVYGIYKYVLSIGSLLLITTLSGMDSAVTQSAARGYEGTLIVGVKTKIKWGILGSITALGISIYYLFQDNHTIAISLLITAFFIPFIESFDMYNALLAGKKLFSVQTHFNNAKKIIALLSIVVTLFFTHNLYIILFVYFLSTLIPNIFIYIKTLHTYKENNLVDPESMKYGKHLSLIHVVGTVLSELDKILLFHYVGAVNLVVYSLASAPTDQIKGLLKNINSLAMPQFSKRSPEDIKKKIFNKLFILGIVTSLIVFCYIFVSPIFFQTFFPKYTESILYSQVLSLSLIAVTLSGFMYTILESQKAKKELYEYNVYTSVFSIIILFPLIYYYGIWGAIITRVITRVFSLGLISRLIKNM